MHAIHIHNLIAWWAEVVALCSLLHTTLPPWDFLDGFPRLQKYYKLFIYVIGYVALNGRSTVYRQISIARQNGGNGGPNPLAGLPGAPQTPTQTAPSKPPGS